jgi:hypothetical protein
VTEVETTLASVLLISIFQEIKLETKPTIMLVLPNICCGTVRVCNDDENRCVQNRSGNQSLVAKRNRRAELQLGAPIWNNSIFMISRARYLRSFKEGSLKCAYCFD